jgi:hypothetical protein
MIGGAGVENLHREGALESLDELKLLVRRFFCCRY